MKWHITERDFTGRACAWQCPEIPGVEVRHCGHMTALRPYHIVGTPAGVPEEWLARKYSHLKAAQAICEGVPLEETYRL